MISPEHFAIQRQPNECEYDYKKRLTPGGILRLVQEISTSHSFELGVTMDLHYATNTAFLLAKLALHMEKPIPFGATLTLDTYPSQQRATFYRYTTVRLEDGTLAAGVDARWVLVDTVNRRILRKVPPELPIHYDHIPVMATYDLSLPKPATPSSLGTEQATYSRCDHNLHLNNTRYADIVCDHLPIGDFENDFLRRLVLLYHREIPLGESFDLSGGAAGDGHYFLARRGGENCFEGFASFTPAPVFDPKDYGMR